MYTDFGVKVIIQKEDDDSDYGADSAVYINHFIDGIYRTDILF